MLKKQPPILSIGADAKTVKGEKLGLRTAVIYLAPWKLSGHNVCACASAGCRKLCLNTAGKGGLNSVQRARKKKTQFLYANREAFLAQLHEEIPAFMRRCRKHGVKPCIRLNGTSDLPWNTAAFGAIPQCYPEVQFYDYTAIPARYASFVDQQGMTNGWIFPRNWHLTWSRKEDNQETTLRFLEKGGTATVVFAVKRGHPLPAKWLGYNVVDGDTHDARFLDPKGVVVGLRAKGKAIGSTSGFVVAV